MFRNKKSEIKRELERYKVLDIAGNNKPRKSNQQHYLLSTLEFVVIVLGCIVFLGALVTALCVTCVRNKRFVNCAGSPFFFSPINSCKHVILVLLIFILTFLCKCFCFHSGQSLLICDYTSFAFINTVPLINF